MVYRFNLSGPGAQMGCGLFLVALGLVLLSPVVQWLIKALGYISLFLGLAVLVLGVLSWLWERRGPPPRQ